MSSAMLPLLTLRLRYEHDVVLARQRARQVAALVGFDAQEQTRLATAVSELARNAYEYAGGGRVELAVDPARSGGPQLVARIVDSGPGIADLPAVLDGSYRSATGLGLGITGARRLADSFRIASEPGQGTTVEVGKRLPAAALPFGAEQARRLADTLAGAAPESSFVEVQLQNQELLRLLDELQARQAEVERLNAELAETNRGVLALYTELDDRAQDLKRLSEVKSRFLSDVGHELRTPLTSVLNLSRLLLDRTDGDLTTEQAYQVLLIRRSIETVTELVNDLLDMAKIEAGKVELRLTTVSVEELFAALRGMVRPLVASDAVALVFDAAPGLPDLETDEARLQQVLRNFVSNAVKFTERGEIRIGAEAGPEGCVRFAVRDSGIGIEPQDQERIFQDYTQVDSPLQRRVRGTGLGLPLTRRLAGMLGGRIELRSAPGRGAEFALVMPTRHDPQRVTDRAPLRIVPLPPGVDEGPGTETGG